MKPSAAFDHKNKPDQCFFFLFFQRLQAQTAGYQTEQRTEEGTTAAAFEGMLEQTHSDLCVRRPIKDSDSGLEVTSLYQTGIQASPVIRRQ